MTGASRGIGAEVARCLARDGFAVAANYASSAEEAEAVVRAIGTEGGKAIAYGADIGDPAAVARMFDEAENAFGISTVVLNNAGIVHLSPITDAEDATFDRVVATNLKGVLNGMREATRRCQSGREAMTRVLAKELGPRRIGVDAISPEPVATELFLTGKSEELHESITRSIAFGRLGE